MNGIELALFGWIKKLAMNSRLWAKKSVCIVAASVIIFFYSGHTLLMSLSNTENREDVLNRVLSQTGKYCEKLKNSVLDFVCVEEIKEKIDYSKDDPSQNHRSKMFRSMDGMMSETKRAKVSSIKTNKYLYDYQLMKKGGQTYEKRILMEENGKSRREENAQLKLETFWHKFVVLGPVGLLSKYWQEHHDYKIIGNKKYRGKKALVIEAIPKNPDETSHLHGKIWVDETDSSILKIEWDVKSTGNYEKIEEFAMRINAEPRITMISEYDVEKNGIRFPSRYSVREAYYSRSGRTFARSEITVTYEEYKFFTVDTEIKYGTNLNSHQESHLNI